MIDNNANGAASSAEGDRIDTDRLLDGIDLVELAGRYVKLRKAGSEFIGLCPFHDEQSPSFHVVPAKGFAHCFGCGWHGDALDLVQQLGGVGFRDACRMLGANTVTARAPRPQRAPEPERVTSKPPADAGVPDMHLRRFGEPVRTWTYRDVDGGVLGYVARYEYDEGGKRKKLTPQWTWGAKADQRPGWGLGHWNRPRPLYGLDRLAAKPEAPVLICEGEKATDAGAQLLPFYVAVSWPGGVNAIKHADWRPMAGRKVVIWPDADQPGRDGAQEIAAVLHGLGCSVRIVDTSDQADGWDLADALAERWNGGKVKAYATARISDWVPPEAEPPPPMPEPPIEAYEPEHTAEVIDLPVARRETPAKREDAALAWPHATPKGKPLQTIENLQAVVEFLGVTVRYNVIGKDEEILVPGLRFSRDNRANASLAWLTSKCEQVGLPTGKIGDYVTFLADSNPYNPVAEWVQSKPWDGQSRLQDLYDTVTVAGGEPAATMKAAFMRRWLISAIAAAFEPDGVSARGVLVFQGEQYLGKTQWFKSLVPAELGVVQDGMLLKPDDKDSVKQILSHWLVELGELDSTFRKSDIAQLKAFIPRKRDILRRAYARRESEFARRTVFFASVNPKEFLHDPTGNSRYWSLECESIDHAHGIDMQQLWAEVLTLYQAGESWLLQEEEFKGLTASNRDFEVLDPIEELIAGGLNWQDPPAVWRWASATDILRDLGRDTPTAAEATRAAHIIRSRNGRMSRKTNGVRSLLVPERRPRR
jgi:predicted P-loop ATPase